MYCNVNAESDVKQGTTTSDEIFMSTVKAPGVPKSWLYLFCLSVAFRMFVVASEGCHGIIGNFKTWYGCFTTWREILLKGGFMQCKAAPKIALFISPVNVLKDLSPAMAKVLFSPGVGAFSAYRLHDGVSVSSDKGEFLLSSIGAVNIVVGYDETCFNFIPSECIITLDSTEFVIPSAIKRYLLFPKGIWKEYKGIAAMVTERMLNMPQHKVDVPFNSAWIGEEMKLFSNILGESFDTSDVCMNFLPAPFDGEKDLQQTTHTLKSCAMFKVVLHMKETKKETNHDEWCDTFIIRNNNQQAYPELFAIFIFKNKSYIISVAYKLSTGDLSVEGIIQAASTKAIFPKVKAIFRSKCYCKLTLRKL